MIAINAAIASGSTCTTRQGHALRELRQAQQQACRTDRRLLTPEPTASLTDEQ